MWSLVDDLNDPGQIRFAAEAIIDEEIAERVKVRCYQFAPWVHYSVDQNTPNVQARSVLEDADEFKEHNRGRHTRPKVRFAGEDLVEYSAREYANAVSHMVWFFTINMLQSSWDQCLRDLCARLAS